MAINDSNAPKGIPSSGEVSPGNTGSDRSINLLKNIKTSTSRTKSNSSVNELRNWFRTYIGSGGDFNNTGGNQTQANLSDWHGTGILGVGVQTTNETQSTYGTNNDATVTLQGFFSEKFKYTFTVNNQSKTSLHGNSVTFTGLQGGNDQTGTEYEITVDSKNTNTFTAEIYVGGGGGFSGGFSDELRTVTFNRSALPTSSFKFRAAYKGAGRVRGTNSTGLRSFGTSNNPINFTYTAAGGAAPGRTSDPLFLLIGKEDPGGRDYGPSFTYP